MKPYTLALAAVFLASPAIAQEYPGNFWVNPQTGEPQAIELGRLSFTGTTYIPPRPIDGWIQIASTEQGNDRIEVDAQSRHVMQSGADRGTVSFYGRTVGARGRSHGLTRYNADCQNFDLEAGGDRVPIGEGTVAEAIYNWACPQ
jgi:hypothetical protein